MEYIVKPFKSASALLGVVAVLGATLTGCLNDSGSPSREEASLVVSTKVTDVNKVNGRLAKASAIKLDRLIITLTSNNPEDAVRRDTIKASDTANSKFTTDATEDQTFSRNFLVKPLRNWTIVVKTLDVNDSVIHYDSTVATSLLVGETRAVTVNLASRFVMYEAKFTVPDSLNFTLLSLKQQMAIRRVVMLVDGDTVADSSITPRFSASPALHTIRFDYISVNQTPDVTLKFFGSVGADTTTRLMFEQTFENVDPNNPNPSGPTTAEYVGPNSTQLGSTVGLTINIGRVGTVIFQPVLNPIVTSKSAAP